MGKFESVLLSLSIFLAGYFLSDGILNFRKDRTIEVRGLAERDVKATEGAWTLGFRATAPDILTLNKEVNSAQASIKNFLLKEGFTADEIRPSSVTVSDSGQYSQNYNRDSRYSASGSINVVSKNVDKVNESSTRTETLLGSGVLLESSYTRFSFTELNEIKPAMLREATASAKEAAEGLARDSEVSLGKLRSASQGLFTISTPGAGMDDTSSTQKRVRVVSRVTFDID